MPHQYSSQDQVRFLTGWFDSWSEFQREDFLPVMRQALVPAENLNGLMGGIASMNVTGRPPSLFDCQVKLFHDWFGNWTELDRNQFLSHTRENDESFFAELQKYIQNETINNEIPATTQETTEELIELTDESNAEVVGGEESTPSSPLSSLPLSQSPLDSGMEENRCETDKQTSVGNIELVKDKVTDVNISSPSNKSPPNSPELSEVQLELNPESD